MVVIGLTGSLGTGKTTVATMLAQLGAKILDADQIAHQLIRSTGQCYQPIIKTFGKRILTRNRIDHKKMAQIVFSSSRDLKKLTQIIHPQVERVIRQHLKHFQSQGRVRAVVLDVPLLFETRLNQLADVVVVVKANHALQIKRVCARLNISQSEALLRIRAQMPIKDKMRLADYVVDNRNNLTILKKQVYKLWTKLQQPPKKKVS